MHRAAGMLMGIAGAGGCNTLTGSSDLVTGAAEGGGPAATETVPHPPPAASIGGGSEGPSEADTIRASAGNDTPSAVAAGGSNSTDSPDTINPTGDPCGNGTCESTETYASCANDCASMLPSGVAAGDLRLAWHDEFDVASDLNPEN